MAKKRKRSIKASARDVSEFARGKASASDKREMGFTKKAGRKKRKKKKKR